MQTNMESCLYCCLRYGEEVVGVLWVGDLYDERIVMLIRSSTGFGDAGMMDFNFEGMNVDEGYDAPHVPPQPPSDGNADAAWYDTDL